MLILILTALGGGVLGFLFCAMLTSGKVADLQSEVLRLRMERDELMRDAIVENWDKENGKMIRESLEREKGAVCGRNG